MQRTGHYYKIVPYYIRNSLLDDNFIILNFLKARHQIRKMPKLNYANMSYSAVPLGSIHVGMDCHKVSHVIKGQFYKEIARSPIAQWLQVRASLEHIALYP